MIKIAEKLTPDENGTNLIPAILRLAGGIWFTARVSAIHIIASIFDKAGIHKETLRKKFIELCSEETPMIRRAVAGRIGELSHKMDWDVYLTEIMPVFKTLASDDQDSVRILCIDSLILISKVFTKDLNKTHMIPILIQLTRDKAWKVRSNLAKLFPSVAEALGKDITDTSLVNIFSTLLQDPEGDVRNIAVTSLSKFATIMSPEKYTIIMPIVFSLIADTLPLVRAGAAEVLSVMSVHLSKEVLQKKVHPAIRTSINDEHDIEVQMEIIKSIKNIAATIGNDFFTLLNELNFKKYQEAPNWRVRDCILDLIIDIAEHFKSTEMFEAHLSGFFMHFLDDKCFSIRMKGVARLPVIFLV